MNIVDIGGAYFARTEPADWICRHTRLAPSGRLLGRIYEVPEHTYRVVLFRRVSGEPDWKGEWWREAAPPVIAATLDEAAAILADYLAFERR